MSDIPVGSPPAPPGRHAAPGGWYPDPLDRGQERYWDGWQWSRTTRPAESPAGAAPTSAPYAGGYPPAPAGSATGAPATGGQSGPYQAGPSPSSTEPPPYGQQGYPQQGYPQQPYQQPYPQQPYPQPPYPMSQGGYQTTFGARAMTADGVPLASWWWRVLAVVVDSILVGLIAALPSIGIYRRLYAQLAVVFAEAMRAAQNGQPATLPSTVGLISSSDQLALSLISVAVALTYHVLFVRFKAATPGKLLCRMRIVPVDVGRHTGRLPWSTALLRAAVWVLPKLNAVLNLFRLLDALFPLWQPKRQALHDLAARTQVVKLN